MAGVLMLRVVPSRLASAAEREAVIAFCSAAYEEAMAPYFAVLEEPTYVLGYLDGELVTHSCCVTRRLQPEGMAPLRTAYVEAVATAQAHRGRGYAAAVMRRIATEIGDYELAALSPSSAEWYGRLGWELWRGPLFERAATGLVRSADDEEVMILRLPSTPPLDVTVPLSIEWRPGEVW
jgi:aminoglycoside 2'-N-acetyltransferase I